MFCGFQTEIICSCKVICYNEAIPALASFQTVEIKRSASMKQKQRSVLEKKMFNQNRDEIRVLLSKD